MTNKQHIYSDNLDNVKGERGNKEARCSKRNRESTKAALRVLEGVENFLVV